MLFQRLFGKKSSDPHIKAVWALAHSQRVFLHAEKTIARAINDYVLKADFMLKSANYDDKLFRRAIRKWYAVEHHSFKNERFEHKRLSRALDLLDKTLRSPALKTPSGRQVSVQQLGELKALRDRLYDWRQNLSAQYTWLGNHPDIAQMRKDLPDLQNIVKVEGQILFDIKDLRLPELVKVVGALIVFTDYPASSKIQSMQYKLKLSNMEWWSREKGDTVEFYHAYPKGNNPIASGGLNKARNKIGFFMATSPQQALDAVELKWGLQENQTEMLKVTITKNLAEKIVAPVYAAEVYYKIPVEYYARANRELQRKFVLFEKV